MLLETKNQPNLILYVTKIDDNPHHFNKLFKLRDEIEQLPQDCLNIKVNFHHCEFLGHYGVAFLGGLFRTDNPQQGDIFLVDTNVWFWQTYTNAGFGANASEFSIYLKYLNQALVNGATLTYK